MNEPPKDGRPLVFMDAGGFGYPAVVAWLKCDDTQCLSDGHWYQLDYQGSLRDEPIILSYSRWIDPAAATKAKEPSPMNPVCAAKGCQAYVHGANYGGEA